MENIIETINDIIIYDPTTLDVSDFKFTNGYYLYTLNQEDRIKPYKISYKYYGTVAYEHIILLINNIKDIWELPIPTILKIPKIEDLKVFIKDKRK
jgi:hypothetical protein